jgi:flagellar biosynthesis GTPase FlhF
MKEYNIQPSHIFNMDEKGFLLGILGRSKRIFSKRQYKRGGVILSLQDGSREWITVLACICSDGTPLSPSLIFQSTAGALQSAWVEAINPNKHSVFVTSSPSGWTNNDIGLAWLKEVFERETARYARTGYRLLIVDGHSSHVTIDFLNYCNNHKILVAVYPPHSTHRLQPLDVGMFGPLAKGDFFELFWRAWGTAFRKETIISSFKASGISPPNPEVILQKFQQEDSKASSSDESSSSVLSGDDWLKIESIIRQEVKDFNNKEVKKLRLSLHHLSAQNSILKGEIQGLREALKVKKRHQKKSYTLQLNNPEEYHGGAIFWSPKKIRQAKEDEIERQQQQQQLQLQKAERSELKRQAQLYKLQIAQERRVERERLKEVREKEQAEKRAEKEAQKAAREAEKAIQLSKKGKRKASQGSSQKQKRQKRVVVDSSHVQAQVAAPAIPTQTTRHGRTTKVPSKYK